MLRVLFSRTAPYVSPSISRSPSFHGRWNFFRSLSHGVNKTLESGPVRPCTQQTILPTGLRVATQWKPSDMATIAIFIDYGSRYETSDTNGAAHFLEHMMFKGTSRRSRVNLEKEIEAIGGQLNAYTSREQTVYSSRVFKKDIAQAVDILADILTQSKLDTMAIEEEKYVILREMEEVEKSVEEVMFDRLHMIAYPNQPLGFTILGPPNNIKAMTRNHLVTAIQQYYVAKRMVVVGVGNVDHKNFVETVARHFSGLAHGSSPLVSGHPYPSRFSADSHIESVEEADNGYVVVSSEAVGWTSPRYLHFFLLQSLLGQYDSLNEGAVPGKYAIQKSIRHIAQQTPLGTPIVFNAFATYYKDTGLFGFYLDAAKEVFSVTLHQLLSALYHISTSITEENLYTAKRQLEYQLLESMETTASISEEIGRHILTYGRHIPTSELLEQLNAVTVQDIRDTVGKHLSTERLAIAAQLPRGLECPLTAR